MHCRVFWPHLDLVAILESLLYCNCDSVQVVQHAILSLARHRRMLHKYPYSSGSLFGVGTAITLVLQVVTVHTPIIHIVVSRILATMLSGLLISQNVLLFVNCITNSLEGICNLAVMCKHGITLLHTWHSLRPWCRSLAFLSNSVVVRGEVDQHVT